MGNVNTRDASIMRETQNLWQPWGSILTLPLCLRGRQDLLRRGKAVLRVKGQIFHFGLQQAPLMCLQTRIKSRVFDTVVCQCFFNLLATISESKVVNPRGGVTT